MIKLVEAGPRMTAGDVAKFANEQMGIPIGVHTVCRRLNDANLFARHSAKKLLISKAKKIKRNGIKIGQENSVQKCLGVLRAN